MSKTNAKFDHELRRAQIRGMGAPNRVYDCSGPDSGGVSRMVRRHEVEVSVNSRKGWPPGGLPCYKCGDQLLFPAAITAHGRVCKACWKEILAAKLRVAEGKRRMIEARSAAEVKQEALEVLREMEDLRSNGL